MKYTVLVCACLSLAWVLTGPVSSATAQETSIEKTTDGQPSPPGWSLACSSDSAQQPLQCRMSQELFSAEARARVLAVSVARTSSGAGYEITLALPHGVYLPAGISLKIDNNQPIKAVIESSNASGIFATVAMDDALAAAIKRGNTMMVGLTNMSRKELQIPVSLVGFTAAFTRMQAIK